MEGKTVSLVLKSSVMQSGVEEIGDCNKGQGKDGMVWCHLLLKGQRFEREEKDRFPEKNNKEQER